MPDGSMTPEEFIPESAKLLRSIRTPQENIDKFGRDAPKNLLGENEEPGQRERELEAARAYERLRYESRYARQDREFDVLVNVEAPQDLKVVVEMIRDAEDWNFEGVIDPYSYRRYMRVALGHARAFSLTSKDLEKWVVAGKIEPDGYLEEGGRVRYDGYDIRIDEVKDRQKIVIPKETYEVNEAGEKVNRKNWEEIEWRDIVKEKVYYGPDKERKALASATEHLLKMMIVGEKLQQQTALLWSMRAALEEMVKTFYLKGIGLTNAQINWFFRAADIGKITAESPDNKELGEKRNKAMRMLYLVGKCETREKMEAHLNETFNLEEILDSQTIERILNMARVKKEDLDDDQKFEFCAKFLIGDGLKITKDRNGNRRYELTDWLTAEQRDPSKVKTGEEKDKRGAGAIKQEKDARGFLTQFGNIFAKNSLDNLYATLSRISLIVGGDKGAIRDADRMFYTWGLRDELGLEIYTKDAIPTGQKLLEKFNTLTDEEWQKYAEETLRYFALPGEPVSTDLSKIFNPKYYRLRDLLNQRPAGSHITFDKFERFTQSLPDLCRTDVAITKGDGTEETQTRSLREQWLGFKGDPKGILGVEKAKSFSEIDFEQVRVPAEIEDVYSGEMKELKAEEVKNYWDKLNIPQDLKESLKASKSVDTQSFMAAARETFGTQAEGVGDNAYGYFWLMNFLSGDANPLKRPWAVANAKVDDLGNPTTTEFYTSKIKFWRIVGHGPALTFGDWRKWYITAAEDKEHRSVDKLLGEEHKRVTDGWRKGFFTGFMSTPEYPQLLAKLVDIEGKHGEMRKSSIQSIMIGGKGKPGLAIKFGFITLEDALKEFLYRSVVV